MSGVNLAMMAGGKRVQLFNRTYTKFSVAPADAYAAYKLDSGGGIWKCEATSLVYTDTLDDWLLVGSAGDYWVRCNYDNDMPNVGSGSFNTWLQLSTPRSWGFEITASTGYVFTNLTIEIASDAGGSNILATGTIYLEAETSP